MMRIDITRGAAASSLLQSAEFRAEWTALHDACPWATVYQGVGFVGVWFEVYGKLHEPVLVRGLDDDGRLVALLTLCARVGTDELAVAGTYHAEYHTWITRADLGDAFALAAFTAIADRFPGSRLRFLFLPPGAPTQWRETPGRWRRQSDLRPMKRALMAVGPGSDSEVSLRKKSNKSRINRLERIAPLRLVKLETEEELAAVLQPIADYCDLRQGAVNAATPFRTDRLKYEFYLAMMRVPGLLHATVLKLGDEVVAAHIGQRDRTHVSLGLIAHSPFVAEHSPGKLLVLMLGVLLGKEGYQNFDLTPGGSYKDRFATHYDEAHVLDVFMSPIASARHATTRQLVSLVKRGAERVGTDPEVLKEFAATALGQVPRWLRSSTPPKLVRHVRRRIYNDAEFRFYRMSAAEAADMQPDAVTMKRDDVADLLCYERASHSDVSERDFLMRALRRIEEGQHVYTYVEDGRLLHYCWLIDRQEVTYSDFGQRVELPPNTSVLYDDYTHPAARGRGLHKAGLRQRLRDAARIPGAEWIAIGVLASNTPSRRNIEAVGFTCFCRAFVQTRGRSKRGWVACT